VRCERVEDVSRDQQLIDLSGGGAIEFAKHHRRMAE
jgi:hypothetical protein